MKRGIHYFAHFILAFLVSHVSVLAQESALDSIALKEAEVISTAKEWLSTESQNREIISINAAELERLSVTSVDEALRYLAGIDVQQRGAFGVQADLSARGATFNQTLVLLDGVRLNDPLTGHFSGYFPIPLAEISRIEVIKGASSGIYGTEAVGAVIQIISKGYDSRQDTSIQAQASIQAGSNASVISDGYIQFNRKMWSMGVGGSTKNSDGHLPAGDSIPYDFSMSTYSINAQLHPNSGLKAGLRFSADERDFSARYFYTVSPIDLSRERISRLAGQAFLKKEITSALRTEIHTGWMQTDDDFLFNPAFTGNLHTTEQTDVHANAYWQAKPHLSYTFGAQSLSRKVESNDRGNHKVQQFGLYATQQWVLYSWRWQLSARLENHDAFGWELVPQTSLGKRFGKWDISAFLGRAIRAADITELYVSNNLETVSPGRNLGNPLLNAESSWNTELNISRELFAGFETDLSLFYRNSNDLIDYVLTAGNAIPNANNIDANGSYFYASNVSELESYGVDLQLRGSQDLSDVSRISYQMGLLLVLHSDSVESKYIAGNEGILINGSLAWKLGRLKLNLNGIYKDRSSDAAGAISRNLPSSYAIFEGGLALEVYKGFAVNAICRNLFDRKYSDVLGAEMPGRWWLLGVRYSF